MGIAADIAIIVVAGLCGGLVAQRLHQPLVLGYIVAGILVGPYTGGISVSSVHEIELLAEIGVALLLFAVGIEVSLRELAPVRRVALVGTPLQILLSMGFGAALAHAFGVAWGTAVWFGGAIALSSTMVVLKTLLHQDRMGALPARVMVGVLIAQDLAFVPLVIVLPQLSSAGGDAVGLVLSVLRAALLLVLLVAVASRVVPWLIDRIARWNSRELFLVAVTAIALGLAYATYLAGMSFAFGGFVAGLAISESRYSHQALGDIRPLRDLFGLLFFASVGMLFDPHFLLEHVGLVAATVLAVTVGKGLIVGAITLGLGYSMSVALAAGLGLFQVGEFSFVLAQVGLRDGGIDSNTYALILATAVITMALTPPLAQAAVPLGEWWQKRRPALAPRLPAGAPALADHVIVAGGGRVGRQVIQVLRGLDVPFVAIELDHRAVEELETAGIPVVYGDAGHEPVLEAAGIARARLLVLAVPSAGVARVVLAHARHVNGRLHTVVRATAFDEFEDLAALGANDIVQPELEGGLAMIRQTLVELEYPADAIEQHVDSLRDAAGRRLA